MFFEEVWARAQGVLFLRGRLNFYFADGERSEANAGAPSCLIAYGGRNLDAIASSGLAGYLVRISKADLTSGREVK